MDGETQMEIIVDDRNMGCIQISCTITDQTQRQTGSIISEFRMEFLLVGRQVLGSPDQLSVPGQRRFHLPQLVQEGAHDDSHEIPQGNHRKSSGVPGIPIHPGSCAPHPAHGLYPGAVPPSHDGDGVVAYCVDPTDSCQLPYSPSQTQGTYHAAQDGGDISYKGFDQDFPFQGQHRSGNEHADIKVQETGFAVEDIDGLLGIGSD